MLFTELDGFLTGLSVWPEPIPAIECMTVVWGAETDGVPPFEDPIDVQWFAKAVAARHDEIARDLARGKIQPNLDVDDRDGEILWEYWIDGFAEAIELRPEAWNALSDDPEWAASWSRLSALIAVARDASDLDSVEVNALQDRAVAELTETVQRLYAARAGGDGSASMAIPTSASKVGRNDPCPCGSGRKHEHRCS